MMKRTVLAIFLIAASPLVAGTNARRGAASLLIPVAGHVTGAYGTSWHTDVTVTNHRNAPQTIAIGFDLPGPWSYGDFDFDTSGIVLPPESSVTFTDIPETLFFFPAQTAIGVLYIRADPPDPQAELDATYRIWTSLRGGGSTSQSSSALDMSRLPVGSETAVIAGVRHDDDYRCNVGIVNTDGRPHDFVVRAEGAGEEFTMNVRVPEFTVIQVPLGDRFLGDATITVSPLESGEYRWTAYATSIDNESSDSWLVNATVAGSGAPSLIVPVAGQVRGANGTAWHTDVTVVNKRDVEQTVMVEFTADGPYGALENEVVHLRLPPHSATTYRDMPATVFGVSGKLGSIYIRATHPKLAFDDDARLDATYRIWTPLPDGGTASQASSALDLRRLPRGGDTALLSGVMQVSFRHPGLDPIDVRCNIGIVNTDIYAHNFNVTTSGTYDEGFMRTILVPGNTVMQLPLGGGSLGAVAVKIEAADRGDYRWTAFATSIDGRTGDSWLVNAVIH